jgi:putative alpha-1,2-mannosidase
VASVAAARAAHRAPRHHQEAISYWDQKPERYVEGDAVQWTFFVPQDPAGLVSLFPSNASFARSLASLFEKSEDWAFGNALPNPQYWAGNEVRPAALPSAAPSRHRRLAARFDT